VATTGVWSLLASVRPEGPAVGLMLAMVHACPRHAGVDDLVCTASVGDGIGEGVGEAVGPPPALTCANSFNEGEVLNASGDGNTDGAPLPGVDTPPVDGHAADARGR